MKKGAVTEVEISDNWKRLTEAIPDIEKYIMEDKIKVIRLKAGMKEPLDNDYYFKKVTLEELKVHKGNYGIIVGYNNGKNGSSIAVADVDGLTIKLKHNIPTDRKEEIKQATKDFIYNSLKEAIPEALSVRTQSGGFHFYLWNETEVANFHEVSKKLTFTSDFIIEELQGKSLEHSIEIFTKFKSKYVVLPTSIVTKLKKGKSIINLEEVREYTILNDVPINLADVGTVKNIHETVKEGLIAKNYGYNEEGTSTSNNRRKVRSINNRRKPSTNKLKKLSDNEITKAVDLITDKYKVFEVIDGFKHYGALALGGFFSYHITKDSSRKIASGIVKKVPSGLFEDSEGFERDILISYERPVEEKQGLPTLLEYIEEADLDFNTEVFSKELIAIVSKEFEETKLKDKFYYNEKEYTIFLLKSKTEEYYLIKNFMKKGLNLEYHKAKHFILIRLNKKPLAKLRLKKTVEGVEATDKGLKRFESKLKDKSIIIDVEEMLEELDLLFTDSKEIKSLEQKIQEEEEKDPIEKLEDNPRNIGALMEFSREYLEPSAKISVAYNPDRKKNEYYILNNGYFEELKEAILHKFIENRFGLRLPEDSVKTLLKSIPTNNTFNNNYFQFSNNIFFNGITGEFEKKEAGFLTDKKVGMNVNGRFKLIRRLTEEELAKDTKENGYSELEKLAYTIMSVPEDKEESLRRYEGFLEWLGYIFRPINTNKKIINLEGLGDDGKSTLIDILIKVVGSTYAKVIIPTELDKDFTEAMLGNKHLIVFDEASTEEIVKHENYIKNASNGRSNRSSRQMFTEDSIDNLRFGLIFILSNLPICFNPSDEALMEREDIIHMFRRFKQNPNKSKGELKAKDVDVILDNDFRGFERIVNLGIIQYNKIRTKKNFTLSTSITETQELILGNDIIKRFLALKTRYDKASVTTNETLTTAFLKWAEAEKIDLTKHFNYKNEKTLKNYIKKQLGSKIKEHYRNIKEEDLVELNENRKKQYCIRILTNSEVTERDNTKYCINEDERAVNQANYLTGAEKLIYNAVHRLEEASLNTLIEETDVPEVELIKTLTNLVHWDYIEEI